MKRTFLVLTVLAGCLVHADGLMAARGLMASVLAELATHTTVTFEMTGVLIDEGNSRPIFSTITFDTAVIDGQSVTRLELLETIDGLLVSRTVADGTRMWSYDVASNSYKSSNYATEAFAGKERDRLFRLMALRTKDSTTFFERVLNDTYGGRAPLVVSNWTPWRPNSTVSISGNNVICGSLQPFTNQLTYVIKEEEGGVLILLGADYYEESVISGRTRTVHWQLRVKSYEIPEGVSFAFVPPAGSRAVAAGEPGGG